jgi:hypothetical protein
LFAVFGSVTFGSVSEIEAVLVTEEEVQVVGATVEKVRVKVLEPPGVRVPKSQERKPLFCGGLPKG